MGYSFTWKDIQKICTGLGMERQGKTNIWKGAGGDGIKRVATIHPRPQRDIGTRTGLSDCKRTIEISVHRRYV